MTLSITEVPLPLPKERSDKVCGGKRTDLSAGLDTGIRLEPLPALTPKLVLHLHHSGRLLIVAVTRGTCCSWLPGFTGQIFTEFLNRWRQLRTVCSLCRIMARGCSVQRMLSEHRLREVKQWTCVFGMDVTDSEKPQTNGEADMLPEKLLEQKIETFRDLPASTKTLTQLPSAPTDFGSGSGGKCHPLQELQACQTPSKNENRK